MLMGAPGRATHGNVTQSAARLAQLNATTVHNIRNTSTQEQEQHETAIQHQRPQTQQRLQQQAQAEQAGTAAATTGTQR